MLYVTLGLAVLVFVVFFILVIMWQKFMINDYKKFIDDLCAAKKDNCIDSKNRD